MPNLSSSLSRLLNKTWQLSFPQLAVSVVGMIIVVALATAFSFRRLQGSTTPPVVGNPYTIDNDILFGHLLLASNGDIVLGDPAQQELSKLMTGKLAHNIPTEMTLGESKLVTVRIARQIIEDLNATQSESEKFRIKSLRIGSVMATQLVSDEGDAFDIKLRFPQDGKQGAQLVAGDEPTEWLWEIKPKESGIHNLRLIATVNLIVSNLGERQKSVVVYSEPVRVRISPLYQVKIFIVGNWQYILTTLLGSGFIGFLIEYMKRRRTRAKRKVPRG